MEDLAFARMELNKLMAEEHIKDMLEAESQEGGQLDAKSVSEAISDAVEFGLDLKGPTMKAAVKRMEAFKAEQDVRYALFFDDASLMKESMKNARALKVQG